MDPIYVIGSSNTDMVVKTNKLPKPGETVIGGTFLMNPGGKGANQAVAAARLGGTVSFIAKVGDDIFGKQAVEQFQKENIDTTFLSAENDTPSGVALISVDSKGENSIVVAPGANHCLNPEDIEKMLRSISPAAILLLQLEIPLETVIFVVKRCHALGLRIILNPAPAQPLDSHLFEHLHMITPNESEAELLTGIPITNLKSAMEVGEKLCVMGVANVIITMGAKGAYLHNKDRSELIPAPLVTAKDTTAAGDCFNGALAVALSEKQPIDQAILFACKAACISVTRMGAQSSLPFRGEVDEL